MTETTLNESTVELTALEWFEDLGYETYHRILEEADQCTKPGEIGSLLRREGLYSSHLTTWRRQRDRGVLNGLSPRKRGPKKKPVNPLDQKLVAQEREINRLRKKLEQAEVIIEFQKKASEILGITLMSDKGDRQP